MRLKCDPNRVLATINMKLGINFYKLLVRLLKIVNNFNQVHNQLCSWLVSFHGQQYSTIIMFCLIMVSVFSCRYEMKMSNQWPALFRFVSNVHVSKLVNFEDICVLMQRSHNRVFSRVFLRRGEGKHTVWNWNESINYSL